MDILVTIGNLIINSWSYVSTLAPFLAAIAFFAALQSEKYDKFFVRMGILFSFLFLGNFALFNFIIAPSYQGTRPLPVADLMIGLVWAGLGAAVYFGYLRFVQPALNTGAVALTKRSAVERNQKTDVRKIGEFLPAVAAEFDPRKSFDLKKGFFLGAGEKSGTYFSAPALPHVQVVGTTGAGKGVALGSLAAQCLKAGEAVFWLDPKDDEWAPHLLAQSAHDASVPFHLIDFRPGKPAQLNFFEGTTAEEREELLLAGFSLSEKGAESDFYSIDDRWGAHVVAHDWKPGDTPATLLSRHGEMLEEKAKKFFGLLREMAELSPVNAKRGIDLAKVVAEGGAVYLIGSMRNAKVVRMQRMMLVRIIQLCERRDRTAGAVRKVCAVLDEAKYHISKPFLESLGAARDKGLHVVLAHQSLSDLRDCPADLNADAVVGAVMENCSLKLVYRVEDPMTAEWLARKSGRIQVDDETRKVVKNAAQAEIVSDERQIRQTERFLIDENMILNLRKSQAVVFGNGLAHFITTSPIPTKKDPSNLIPQAFEGAKIRKPQELI